MVKCLPAMRETRVQSLDWEDPLEKEMATHSSTHAWKIPWMEKPGGLQSMGLQRVGHNWATSHSPWTSIFLFIYWPSIAKFLFVVVVVFTLELVNYKLALANSICQQLNNKGICYLPVLLQLLWHSQKGIQGGEWGTLCSRETGGIDL